MRRVFAVGKCVKGKVIITKHEEMSERESTKDLRIAQ